MIATVTAKLRTLALLLLLAAPMFAAAEIRMTPATPEQTQQAIQHLTRAFQSLDTLRDAGLTGDVVMVGPRLWAKLRKRLEHVPERGASVVIVMADEGTAQRWGIARLDLASLPEDKRPVFASLAKTGKYLAEVGAMKQGAPSLMTALGELFTPGTQMKVREASRGELSYYWALISYDLEAPILTLESPAGNFLFDFGADLQVSFIELLPEKP